jgi:putative ABC transport system permease protein
VGCAAGLAVRVKGDPLDYSAAVREAVWSADRNQPVAAILPLAQLVADRLVFRDTAMRLLTAFAALALLIGAVGLYGLLAYSVGQRTREIGVRVALGAKTGDVLSMVLRDGLKLLGLGIAAGAAAGYLLARVVTGMLYGVHAQDAGTFVCAAIVLLACGFVASIGPSLRAAAVDPMTALRLE